MRKAFTLVELLVVIAIISLLISILAPSLNVAKEIARQIQCGSNMNAAGKAIHLYCQMNNDRYPPWRSRWKNKKPIADPMPNAEKTFQIAKVGDLDGVTLKQQWRGAGMVYGAGYMETPDHFYCPGATSPWFRRESYENSELNRPFGSHSLDTGMVRSGLLWNVWGRRYKDVSDMLNQNWDFAFRTLSSMENDKPLIIDHAIFPWMLQVHTARGVENPTFNVAFNDAHVSSYTVSEAYVEVCIQNWSDRILIQWADYPGPYNDWADAWEMIQQQL